MNTTIKSTKAIKLAKMLPAIPAAPGRLGHNEIQQVEMFIRSVGGKPMTQLTKHRLAKAGCRGFPED
jgi:hypothetical protein